MGDTAAVTAAYAQAQAIATMNSSLVTSGNIAMKTMPRLYTSLMAMLLMVFPLVVILALIPNNEGPSTQSKEQILGVYLKSLLFLGMFPPLYAVANFFSTVSTVRELESVAALSGGLSIQTMDMIGNSVISDLALQGWITTVAVPAIAGLLAFRGGGAAMGMVSGFMGQVQSAANSAGAGAAMGNFNQGNLSMDNASANKVDMSGSYMEPTRYQQTSGAGWTNTFSAGGGHVMDGSKAVDNFGAFNLKSSSRLAASTQRQSEAAETAAVGNMKTYAETSAASLQQQAGFERVRGAGARAGVHDGVGQGSSRGQEASQAWDLAGQFGKEHKLNQSQAAEVMLQARASASLGGKIPGTDTGASVSAIAQLTGKSSAEAGQLLKSAQQFNEKTGFGTKVDTAIKSAHDSTFDTTNESSRRGMESIRGGYDKGQQAMDQASANIQQSKSYKEASAKIVENAQSIDRTSNQQFKLWLAEQDNGNGQKLGLGGAISMVVGGGTRVEAYAEQFLRETEAKELHRLGVADTGTAKDVREFHQVGAAGIKGADHVAGQGAQWQAAAGAQAAKAGVNPRDSVTSNVPQQAEQRFAQDAKAVDAGRADVANKGAPLQQEAGARTQPGSQKLAGLASTNAVAQVAPDGVSRVMMEKTPGIDTSVGTPGAAVAEASADRARGGKK